MKLVPFGDKYEVRLKGSHITPGYWNDKVNTKKSFDNEGYFKIGDALKFEDKLNPEKGFYFDGRIAENFKLNTGTWGSVGNVRSKLLDALGGIATDAIIVGEDQEYLSAFLIPNISFCSSLLNLETEQNEEIILSSQRIKNKILEILTNYKNNNHSKSQYIKKVVFFRDSLSKSKGEITDKGSINQIKFILNRDQLVKSFFMNQLKEIISI
jgi:feruloyl-CoA synthase